MFQHRELRRCGKFRCKIFHKHAQHCEVFAPLEVRRALLQIFIKTTPHHRLSGLVCNLFGTTMVAQSKRKQTGTDQNSGQCALRREIPQVRNFALSSFAVTPKRVT
jgi:hypothetical protein